MFWCQETYSFGKKLVTTLLSVSESVTRFFLHVGGGCFVCQLSRGSSFHVCLSRVINSQRLVCPVPYAQPEFCQYPVPTFLEEAQSWSSPITQKKSG